MVVGCYAMVTDITSFKQTQRALAALTRTDALTGLPNRVELRERIEEALARSRRKGSAVGCLYLDVDNFKEVNDTLGHAGGDAVLVEFSERLKSCVRQTDVVARLAGDEFVIVLEGIEAVCGGATRGRKNRPSHGAGLRDWRHHAARHREHRRGVGRSGPRRRGHAAAQGGLRALPGQTLWPKPGGRRCRLTRPDLACQQGAEALRARQTQLTGSFELGCATSAGARHLLVAARQRAGPKPRFCFEHAAPALCFDETFSLRR